MSPVFADSFYYLALMNPEDADHARALELSESGVKLFSERQDKSWSLTDCISFAAMAELGITEALTGDQHFRQAGFRALLR